MFCIVTRVTLSFEKDQNTSNVSKDILNVEGYTGFSLWPGLS